LSAGFGPAGYTVVPARTAPHLQAIDADGGRRGVGHLADGEHRGHRLTPLLQGEVQGIDSVPEIGQGA
jgi:hypothetical protein